MSLHLFRYWHVTRSRLETRCAVAILLGVLAVPILPAAAARAVPLPSPVTTRIAVFGMVRGQWVRVPSFEAGQQMLVFFAVRAASGSRAVPRARLEIRHYFDQGTGRGVLAPSVSEDMGPATRSGAEYRFTATLRLPLGMPLSGTFVTAFARLARGQVRGDAFIFIDAPSTFSPDPRAVMTIRQAFAFCAHQTSILRRDPRTRPLRLGYGAELRAYYHDDQSDGEADTGEVVDNPRYVAEVIRHPLTTIHGIRSGTGIANNIPTLRYNAWNTMAGALGCWRGRPEDFWIRAAHP